jgi:hypothetical protein
MLGCASIENKLSIDKDNMDTYHLEEPLGSQNYLVVILVDLLTDFQSLF